MADRSPLRNYAEYAAVRLALGAVALLPDRLAVRLARWLPRLAASAAPRWRRTALRNLHLAFSDGTPAQYEELLSGCFDNLGRVLFTLARAPRWNAENIQSLISYEGYQHYQEAKRGGRGVIFLTAHLGNWELSAMAHAWFGHPMWVMVRPLDNPLLDAWLDRRRRLCGNRTVAKTASMKGVLRALRENGDVGILADQNAAADDGVFVDVFRIPASASQGVARLALRSGAAIIPGFAFWNADTKRHVLKFYEPLKWQSRGESGDEVRELTQLCQAAIERAIRERPEQWLWIHARWKTRPPGGSPLY